MQQQFTEQHNMVLSRAKKDLSGLFFRAYDGRMLLIKMKIATFFVRMQASLRGVKLGEGCRFFGKTYFRRFEGSRITIGNNCRFRSSYLSNQVGLNRKCMISTFNKNAEIIIGDNAGLSGTVIGAANKITLGKNILCGGNTFITDFDWHPINRHAGDQTVHSAPVVIEDNVWLGLNTVILKGVHIGKNSVIGANSVVVKSIPADVIAAGNPCRVIKNLTN